MSIPLAFRKYAQLTKLLVAFKFNYPEQYPKRMLLFMGDQEIQYVGLGTVLVFLHETLNQVGLSSFLRARGCG